MKLSLIAIRFITHSIRTIVNYLNFKPRNGKRHNSELYALELSHNKLRNHQLHISSHFWFNLLNAAMLMYGIDPSS